MKKEKDKKEDKKEEYRKIFKGLYEGLQQAMKEWARQEGGWDEETWIETLEALMRIFQDYREAEQWIRKQVLKQPSTTTRMSARPSWT